MKISLSPLPETPLVSIVMPAFNAARTIGESIQSVIDQTYAHWELLVIDDGSTDETGDVIRSLSADPRVKALRTAGRDGPAIARNIGLRLATGRLIAFLDSDDLWLPQKLARQIEFMREHDSVFSFTAYSKIDEYGVKSKGHLRVPATVRYVDLLKSNSIGCLTAMFDRQRFPLVVIPVLGHEVDYGVWRHFLGGRLGHEDYGFWLRLLRDGSGSEAGGVVAHGLNQPLALYRVGHTSLSSNKFRAAMYQWLVYRKVERLSLPVALYYFIQYAWHGFRKSQVR